MTKTINLNPYLNAITLITAPLRVPETLSFKLQCQNYANIEYFIVARNREAQREQRRLLATNEEFFLAPDLYKTGTIEISIDGQVNGVTVAHWEVKPILVVDNHGTFEFDDKLKSLEERIKKLEEQHKPLL